MNYDPMFYGLDYTDHHDHSMHYPVKYANNPENAHLYQKAKARSGVDCEAAKAACYMSWPVLIASAIACKIYEDNCT